MAIDKTLLSTAIRPIERVQNPVDATPVAKPVGRVSTHADAARLGGLTAAGTRGNALLTMQGNAFVSKIAAAQITPDAEGVVAGRSDHVNAVAKFL